jgi:predicted outer membrane protein
MLRKSLAVTVLSLFVGGAAFATPPAMSGQAEQSSKLSDAFSDLHAVGRWSTSLSEMAGSRAKSDLVKDYARTMANANAAADQKVMDIAKNNKIDIHPPDPQTEKGKSLADRMQAEAVMLGSLQGDAFDKEYMTLVTNTQQSVINVLEKRKASASSPEVKQFLGDMETTVQNRLQKAQDIMVKVYGDTI